MARKREVIFLAGSDAKAAYLTQSGSLTYFHGDGPESVSNHAWISEVCLWTPWLYLGDLVADDVSRLAVLDAEEFCSARRYGQEFLEAMRKQETWTATGRSP